jgi:hypothetical protein
VFVQEVFDVIWDLLGQLFVEAQRHRVRPGRRQQHPGVPQRTQPLRLKGRRAVPLDEELETSKISKLGRLLVERAAEAELRREGRLLDEGDPRYRVSSAVSLNSQTPS